MLSIKFRYTQIHTLIVITIRIFYDTIILRVFLHNHTCFAKVPDMALIEGIGDDVTVTVLLFIGVLTFYLWKVCFSSLRSYHDLPPRQTEVARSHSLDSSRVGEGETRVEQPRVDDDERETGEGVEGTPSEDVDGTIVVKLRHQETERVARVRRDQTVEELKR